MTPRRWRSLAWVLWLAALAVGATAAAEFGTRGTWYVGFAIGCTIGMATWFPRPRRFWR